MLCRGHPNTLLTVSLYLIGNLGILSEFSGKGLQTINNMKKFQQHALTFLDLSAFHEIFKFLVCLEILLADLDLHYFY